MSLPAGFQFSQSSLQDYVDCRRRFQLKYLLRLAWPAIESEPVMESEHFMQQGARFHRLVQQHLLGVPVERLAAFTKTALSLADEDLERWWGNYLREKNPSGVEDIKNQYPEINLSAPLGGYRLAAKYDLLVVGRDDRLVIVDWKTSRKRPRRGWLMERLQTRVYPYLLVRAGGQFLAQKGARHFGSALHLEPEQVEMVYWFAEFPDQAERIAYSQERYQEDAAYLEGLLAEIQRRGEADFNLTPDEKQCAYCKYRSLCERGREAGALDDLAEDQGEEDTTEIRLDFDQIAEIEF